MTANIEHGVDGAGSAQRPAARLVTTPATEPGCGTVSNAQLLIFGLPGSIATMPIGARTNRPLPSPPASSRQTEIPGSSLNRAASTEPADPPPTMT
jgi:hypothetical protein